MNKLNWISRHTCRKQFEMETKGSAMFAHFFLDVHFWASINDFGEFFFPGKNCTCTLAFMTFGRILLKFPNQMAHGCVDICTRARVRVCVLWVVLNKYDISSSNWFDYFYGIFISGEYLWMQCEPKNSRLNISIISILCWKSQRNLLANIF